MNIKALTMAAVAAAALALGIGSADAASGRVQVGVLSCNIQGGIGYIIGSSKDMTCSFSRNGYRSETYYGNISKLGLDIGITHRARLEWVVFAATSARYTPHALAGDYVGGAADASFGVGAGANWLIGGSHRSFALQPVSVQAQTGFNLAIGLASLTLR